MQLRRKRRRGGKGFWEIEIPFPLFSILFPPCTNVGDWRNDRAQNWMEKCKKEDVTKGKEGVSFFMRWNDLK